MTADRQAKTAHSNPVGTTWLLRERSWLEAKHCKRGIFMARDQYEFMAGECRRQFPIWIPARIMMVTALRALALRAGPVFYESSNVERRVACDSGATMQLRNLWLHDKNQSFYNGNYFILNLSYH
ncbi:hypothetical protein GR157_19470 [Burkholderia sp. 4701]|nr:hypothetical protein [Burkholderia sp. 4701]MXN83846.1 hypothetical protein [Burkholderia sp. 4812]